MPRRCRARSGAGWGRSSCDASRTLWAAVAVWSRDGLRTLTSGEQDLAPLAIWAVVTVALWWAGRSLAPALRPGARRAARTARPHHRRRHRRARAGAGADPRRLAGRPAAAGKPAAVADRRPAPAYHREHHRRAAGGRPQRDRAGAEPAGSPRARLHRFERPAPVDEPAAADDRQHEPGDPVPGASPRAAIASALARSARWCSPRRSRCSPCRSCPTRPGMPGRPTVATDRPALVGGTWWIASRVCAARRHAVLDRVRPAGLCDARRAHPFRAGRTAA